MKEEGVKKVNSLLSESINSEKKMEFPAIDITKMICALMVVSIHIDIFGNNNPIYDSSIVSIVASGWFPRIAVPFFFMSSGFFLFRKMSYDAFEPSIIWRYVKRIVVLYLVWSIIYLPLEIKELALDQKRFFEAVLSYIYHFIFIGSYTHLWYLPALIVAVLLVSFCIRKKMLLHKILVLSGIFYMIGLLGNSWYGLTTLISQALSLKWNIVDVLLQIFGTTRNGIFCAFLFVTLGAFCAYKQVDISIRNAGTLFILFYILMLMEIIFLYYRKFPKERDMTLCLVPTVFFLFLFVSKIRIKDDNGIYKKLRFCSSVTFFLI